MEKSLIGPNNVLVKANFEPGPKYWLRNKKMELAQNYAINKKSIFIQSLWVLVKVSN